MSLNILLSRIEKKLAKRSSADGCSCERWVVEKGRHGSRRLVIRGLCFRCGGPEIHVRLPRDEFLSLPVDELGELDVREISDDLLKFLADAQHNEDNRRRR